MRVILFRRTGESEGVPTLPVPESERSKGTKSGAGRVSKMGVPKSENDEIKGPKSGARSSEICCC